MAKLGRPRVLDAHRRMTVRLETSELNRAEKLIQVTGLTQTQIVRRALAEFIDRHEGKIPA
jgi:hypothetical protein